MNIFSLIDCMCPDGVEYVELGEVCEYIRGVVYNKSDEVNEEARFKYAFKLLRANNINLNTNTLDLDDIKYIKNSVKVKEQHFLKKRDIIICAGSGSKQHIGKVAYIFKDMDYTFGGFMGVLRCISDMNSRFLFHILTSNYFSSYLNYSLNSTTINNINTSIMKKFKIPLPPLEIQNEIVRILDKFTTLIQCLEKELEARKKQYEYYRDMLLSFGDDVEYVRIGDCIEKVSKINWEENKDIDYKYIDLTSINNDVNKIKITQIINSDNAPSRAKQIVKKGDILFATTRPTLEKYTIIDDEYDEQICSTGFCVLRVNNIFVLKKWVYYFITSTKFFDYVHKNQEGASYPSISDSKVKDFKIPLPPLETQQKIVEILDRFNSLCNDISEGIPAEIEARKKQYEYYRDKLLNFKAIQ